MPALFPFHFRGLEFIKCLVRNFAYDVRMKNIPLKHSQNFFVCPVHRHQQVVTTCRSDMCPMHAPPGLLTQNFAVDSAGRTSKPVGSLEHQENGGNRNPE